ncbi:MAG: response regulator [Thermoanaerobaculaceae bacterium]|jgi:DNA-binding response OmpR family regulator/HPt (histidine-containing phosphotransfer) domain-containing protein|nr:response regulator [Thermoanaerobaculaceae bacterium]
MPCLVAVVGHEEGTVARRVLVVEDEPKLAELVKAFLVEKGFVVLVAHDGEKGLEMARRERPDLVLSDVLLPRLIGWELCRRIKAEPTLEHTRVVLMTAVYTKARYRNDATEAGADDFVSKPLDLDDLAVRLAHLLPAERPAPRLRPEAAPPRPPEPEPATPPPPRPEPVAPRPAVKEPPQQSRPVEPKPVSRQPAPEPAPPPAPVRPTPVVATSRPPHVDVDAALAGLVPPRRKAPKPEPAADQPAGGNEAAFDARLAAMRRKFAQALPGSLAQIERTWAVAAGGCEIQPWEDLARLAHDLAGSAGSFGFPAVGDAARELEEVVRTHLARGEALAGKARGAVKQHVERLGTLVHLL